MKISFTKGRSIFALFGLVALLCVSATAILAQTASTGALTGVVTDPSGAVIPGATVTLTNTNTGMVRTASTDAKGAYEFSLLPPGTYSVKFASAGFETSEVSSVNVNVTETPVLNRSLQVGSQSQKVIVEANTQAIQTENATVGGVVGSHEITSLPLSTRNYTQILDLSPGVVTNVANASGFGNGTQDVNVNGSTVSSNNYSMNGVDISGFTTGMAAQESTYVPIPVPNPDTIQEFKVQTAQYDAAFGRNSGADVAVVTKSGTNNFHGDAWEFNRNNFFNANDYFNKSSELNQLHTPNSPQTLKQNQFGFTLGGPIIKNKVFFFGSYQGTRQINGVVSQGFSTVNLPDINDYADVASNVCANVRCTGNTARYQAFLGSVFGVGGPEAQGSVSGTGPAIAANGSNINPVTIALFQAAGLKGGYNQGFFVAGAPSSCAAPCLVSLVDPARANENQYMINTDYDLSSKNTLSERFFYSSAPTLLAFGSSMPGSPSSQQFSTDVGSLKLTSILSGNLVNEATFSLNRALAVFSNGFTLTACDVGITPAANNGAPCPLAPDVTPGIGLLPTISVLGVPSAGYYNAGAFSMGGSVFTYGSSVNNTFQGDDQLSWNHGRHSIRVGFNAQRDQWVYSLPSENKNGMSFLSMGDLLYGGPGTIDALGAAQVRGLPSGIGVNIRETDFSSYFQDDIKVNDRLTIDAGVRWEYEGFPYGADGQLTNVWPSLLSTVNTGSFFAPGGNPANSIGTLAGYVVQSTFPVAKYGLVSPTGATGVVVSNNNKLLPGGAPRDVFDPRLGLAWRPFGNKFVVRAGYGWFHDHVAASLIGKELDTNPPEIAPYTTSQLPYQTIANPFPVSYQGLSCPATGGVCPALGWVPRSLSSPFTVVTVSPHLRLPLSQEYNLDLQYQVAPGWLVSLGYVGSHAVGLEDEGRAGNTDYLIAGAPNTPAGLFGEVPSSALPFNDPLNANPLTTNNGPGPSAVSMNQLERVAYLGLGTEGGLYQILTDGKEVYNSLQASVQHQFAHGLSFQASYTWSKAMTDVSGGFTGAFPGEAGNLVEGGLNSGYAPNSAQQYGLSEGNRPQRLVLSYAYNLPYKGTKGLDGKLLAGWTISGVTTVQDGEPFSVTDGRGGSIYGSTTAGGNSRAELLHPKNCNALGNCQSAVPIATPGGTEQRLNCWIALSTCSPNAAFALSGGEPLVGGTPNTDPGPYTAGTCTTGSTGSYEFYNCGTIYGNSGVGVITGPGQFNFDMALAKTLPITEGTHLEFRAEAFNIWNHTQFNPPSTSLTSSTAGRITSVSVPPRILQFGVKFYF